MNKIITDRQAEKSTQKNYSSSLLIRGCNDCISLAGT